MTFEKRNILLVNLDEENTRKHQTSFKPFIIASSELSLSYRDIIALIYHVGINELAFFELLFFLRNKFIFK